MEKLHIEITDSTPEIIMDHSNGEVHIKGESRPENVYDFYSPVLQWTRQLHMDLIKEKEKINGFTINVSLDYFNSSSAKCLMDLFVEFHNIIDSGCMENITVNWYYDPRDDEMKEAAEDLSEIVDLEFTLIKKA